MSFLENFRLKNVLTTTKVYGDNFLLEQQRFVTMSFLENFRLKNKHKKMCGLNKVINVKYIT